MNWDGPETRFVRLHDGRRLAYTEWGDPAGSPVVHMHGMPGSRYEHEAPPDYYRSLGVRVITPDRPGYGMSDPQRHRRLVDWPADVAELADALGIARFGVTALSGGGIYALACAALIPDRVTAVVTTGCPGPMQFPGALNNMRLMTRAGVWLAARMPWLFEAGAAVLAGVVHAHPRFFIDQAFRDKPAADLRLFSSPAVAAGAAATLREAMHRGASGYVQDIQVLALPWNISLGDIHVPVELWHGDQDNVIPVQHGYYLKSVMPGATLRICPGEAHMLLWSHLAEVMRDVTATPSPRAA
ncbi:MAG TPA: alpha/beta hydrolase [Candidatus Dormibacteraeota bacterium]|nr:alpha/beta hydrolase [Candidatus Dormibacteraeota bacterium]